MQGPQQTPFLRMNNPHLRKAFSPMHIKRACSMPCGPCAILHARVHASVPSGLHRNRQQTTDMRVPVPLTNGAMRRLRRQAFLRTHIRAEALQVRDAAHHRRRLRPRSARRRLTADRRRPQAPSAARRRRVRVAPAPYRPPGCWRMRRIPTTVADLFGPPAHPAPASQSGRACDLSAAVRTDRLAATP
eukprot:364595-Chlamydomonas_euryale.AAC.3